MKQIKYILILILCLACTQVYAQNAIGYSKDAIETSFPNAVEGITDDGDEYLLINRKDYTLGYMFNARDICHIYIVFPKNTTAFRSFAQDLDNDSDIIKVADERWKEYNGAVTFIINVESYGDKTGFVWRVQ